MLLETFQKFKIEFYQHPNKYQSLRFGQALINTYMHLPEIEAIQFGSYIWEDNDPDSVLLKLIQSGAIDGAAYW